MATIRIRIRNSWRIPDEQGVVLLPAPHDDVELDDLSPRARALAEAISHCPDGEAGTIRLESTLRVRDIQPNWEMWYTSQQADQPLRMDWSRWDRYPADSALPAADWLERQAAKIPAGYRIVGACRTSLGGEPEVRVDDTSDLMTAQAVAALLATCGRHITASTWRAYVARGQAPAPVRHVGRTPLWDAEQIRAWAPST